MIKHKGSESFHKALGPVHQFADKQEKSVCLFDFLTTEPNKYLNQVSYPAFIEHFDILFIMDFVVVLKIVVIHT